MLVTMTTVPRRISTMLANSIMRIPGLFVVKCTWQGGNRGRKKGRKCVQKPMTREVEVDDEVVKKEEDEE